MVPRLCCHFRHFCNHVLLGHSNHNYTNREGTGARPDHSFQLLLSLQELHNLSLLLPPKTITFQRHETHGTIDLVFSTSPPSHTLTKCYTREDLDHRSDHYPIKSSFLFSPLTQYHIPKPLWRKADKAAQSICARELDLFP